MLRRLEIKKKKDDKEEADKLEKAEAHDSEKKSRDFVGTCMLQLHSRTVLRLSMLACFLLRWNRKALL